MKNITTHRAFFSAVAVVAALALPMVAGAANKLVVQDATGTLDKMVVTDQGWVGIGTNVPVSGLNLSGTAGAEATQIRSTYFGDINTGSGGVVMMRTRANASLPISGDRLGYLLFGSVDNTTTPSTNKYSAGIFTYADGVWTSTSTPSYYAFETTQTSKNTRDEWMRITSSGKIGINTPTPQMQLEVNGGLRLNASSTSATVTSPARVAPTKPVCDNTSGPNIGGTFWFTKSASNVADILEFCSKDASNNYAWRSITLN